MYGKIVSGSGIAVVLHPIRVDRLYELRIGRLQCAVDRSGDPQQEVSVDVVPVELVVLHKHRRQHMNKAREGAGSEPVEEARPVSHVVFIGLSCNGGP
jgi:hypothetical protein